MHKKGGLGLGLGKGEARNGHLHWIWGSWVAERSVWHGDLSFPQRNKGIERLGAGNANKILDIVVSC